MAEEEVRGSRSLKVIQSKGDDLLLTLKMEETTWKERIQPLGAARSPRLSQQDRVHLCLTATRK